MNVGSSSMKLKATALGTAFLLMWISYFAIQVPLFSANQGDAIAELTQTQLEDKLDEIDVFLRLRYAEKCWSPTTMQYVDCLTTSSFTDTNIFTSGVSDCAAGNYVYGFNTNGTVDCRADVIGGGASTTDTTLDTNTAAQDYYWSNMGITTTGADANVADDITLTNITQVTNRAFSDISSRNFSLLSLDSNGNFDARYCLLTDSNSPSRLSYAVIADPPWGGTSTTDTTLDTNTAAQDYYWSNMGITTTGADANVADDLTINTTADANFSQNIGVDGNLYVPKGSIYADENVFAPRYCFTAACSMWMDFNGDAVIIGG